LHLLKKGSRLQSYVSDLKVDAASDSGLSKLDKPSRTAFSFDV
jgi:hypothetical protein